MDLALLTAKTKRECTLNASSPANWEPLISGFVTKSN